MQKNNLYDAEINTQITVHYCPEARMGLKYSEWYFTVSIA